jgi:integral membrane protein
MNLKTTLGQFRILAVLEGISWPLLLITMYMKYQHDMLLPNKIVGMIHGVFFIFFCIWLVIYAKKANWKITTVLLGFVASFVPFGTFIFDAKVLKKEKA